MFLIVEKYCWLDDKYDILLDFLVITTFLVDKYHLL